MHREKVNPAVCTAIPHYYHSFIQLQLSEDFETLFRRTEGKLLILTGLRVETAGEAIYILADCSGQHKGKMKI